MDNIYAELRELIDNQDLKAIEALIKAHPEIDHNDTSPNGASTLWCALMPRAGQEISPDLIEFLVNYKKPDSSPLVNPTQEFLNCRPVNYLEALGNANILTIIQKAENNYRAPAPVNKIIYKLKDIAKDKQNVHLEVNIDLSYNNTIRLYQHYVIKNNLILDEENLKTIREEIENFCNTEKESLCKDLKHPRERQDYIEQVIFGLNYCFSNSTVFKFKPEKILI